MPGAITKNLRYPRDAAATRWHTLAPLVDRELQRLAGTMLHAYQRASLHSIEPAELVNEFYIRLLRDNERHWHDRAHFYSYASAVMRTILIDRHRVKAAQKRPPASRRESVADLRAEFEPAGRDCSSAVELRIALGRLERLSPRQAKIVQWRYFFGLEIETIAARCQLSEKTVRRDLIAARAFLLAELHGAGLTKE